MLDIFRRSKLLSIAVSRGIAERKAKFPVLTEKNEKDAIKFQTIRIKAIHRLLINEAEND